MSRRYLESRYPDEVPKDFVDNNSAYLPSAGLEEVGTVCSPETTLSRYPVKPKPLSYREALKPKAGRLHSETNLSGSAFETAPRCSKEH